MEFDETFAHYIRIGDLKSLNYLNLTKKLVNELFIFDIKPFHENDGPIFDLLIYPTPLIYSICCQQKEIVNYLLNIGADYNKTVNGWNPIHYSVFLGNIEITKLLLNKESSLINIETNDKSIPLNLSVSSNNFEMTYFLIKSGANIHYINSMGNSLLHLASICNDLWIPKLILSYGINIDIKNKKNQSPIDIAKIRKNNSFLKIINNIPKIEEIDEYYNNIQIKNNNNFIDPLSSFDNLNQKIIDINQRIFNVEMKL